MIFGKHLQIESTFSWSHYAYDKKVKNWCYPKKRRKSMVYQNILKLYNQHIVPVAPLASLDPPSCLPQSLCGFHHWAQESSFARQNLGPLLKVWTFWGVTIGKKPTKGLFKGRFFGFFGSQRVAQQKKTTKPHTTGERFTSHNVVKLP